MFIEEKARDGHFTRNTSDMIVFKEINDSKISYTYKHHGMDSHKKGGRKREIYRQ